MKLADGQTIVFFGDSITKANFGSNYITALKSLFSEYSVDSSFHLINAGRDGDMVEDLLYRVQDDVLSHKPDWIVVLVGINDAFYESVRITEFLTDNTANEPSMSYGMVERFRNNYLRLIDTLKDGVQNLALCTTTDVEGDLSLDIADKLILINDVIRSISLEKNCGLIDLSLTFKESLTRLNVKGRNNELLLTVDGVHLNDRGARLVAEAILDFFVKDQEETNPT